MLTTLLVLTILGVTDFAPPVGFAGIAIGLCLPVIQLVSIPVTNPSVNLARSIGLALFAGPEGIGELWLLIVAPVIAGGIAAAIYAVIRPIEPAAQLSTRRDAVAFHRAGAPSRRSYRRRSIPITFYGEPPRELPYDRQAPLARLSASHPAQVAAHCR